MAGDIETKIAILAETESARSNIGRLDQAFKEFLREAGASETEIKAFIKIAKDAEASAEEISKLDAKTRGLIGTYRELNEVARAKDVIGFIPADRIQGEIDKVRGAFETLRKSGTLSQAEIAQAAERTAARVKDLSTQAGGLGASFGRAGADSRGFAGAVGKSSEALDGMGAAAGGASFKLRDLFSTRSLFLRLSLVIGGVVTALVAAAVAAKAVGEAAAKYLSPSVREAEQATAGIREELAGTAGAARAAAFDLRKFADVQTLNSKQLLKLSADDRQAYADRLAGAREYYASVNRAALIEQELGHDTKATQEQAGKALKKLIGDYAELEKAIQFAADAAKQGINIDAAQAIEQFKKLRAESTSTEQSLKAVAGAFDLNTSAGVQSFAQALGELSVQGLAGAKDIGAAWDDVLSKFTGFAVTAKAKLGESARDVQALADITDSALRASLRALGEDADKAISGMSAAASEAIANIETVVESGRVSGAQLSDAFNKSFEKLDTVKAVEQMKAVLIAFGNEGKLSVAQVTEQIEKLDERTAGLTPGIQTVAEAWKQLGVESVKSLDEVAAKARESFEFIRDSSEPIEEIRRAFLAYAKAALAAAEASGKPADGLLSAQAAAIGLTADLEKLVGENQKLTTSFEAVARAQDQAIKATEAHTKSVEAEGRAAIATAQAALEQAKQRNNALEITRATIALAETEAAVAANVAEAKLAEAAAADQKVAAVERDALADGKLTEAEREVLAVAQEVASAKQSEADAAQASADAKAQEATITGKVAEAEQGIAVSIEAALAFQRERLTLTEQYGKAAGDIYDKVALGIEAAARGENALIELTGGLIERLRRDSAEAAGEILGLTAKLASADAPTQDLTRAAQQALDKYKDLGDEALAGLRQALDDARQRTEALRDAAKSTVEQLRDQFDQLKGNEESIAAREYQRKKAELQAQLQEAQKAGDAQAQKDLQEALRLLEQIRVERERQAAAEAKTEAARKKATADKAKEAAGAPPPEGAAPPPPGAGAGGGRQAPGRGTLAGGAFAPVINLYGTDLTEDAVRRKLVPLLEKIARQVQ